MQVAEDAAVRILSAMYVTAPRLLMDNNCRELYRLADWLGIEYIWDKKVILVIQRLTLLYQHMGWGIRAQFDMSSLIKEFVYQFVYALEHDNK